MATFHFYSLFIFYGLYYNKHKFYIKGGNMLVKFESGQHVYFLISGRYITEAEVVAASSWFVTIKFKKTEDCIIRLPYSRIFRTKEEANQHILPELPPLRPASSIQKGDGGLMSSRRWDLWE